MIYKHFSKKESIESIYESKKLWLTRLVDCVGQQDFCLTEKMFFDMLNNIDYSCIKYNDYFSKDKFIQMCNCKIINDNYKVYEKNFYGACITIDGDNDEFREKYGDCHISFELDAIKMKNTDFLMIYDVVYSLDNIEQYVYDLASYLYLKGEYQTRYALELKYEEMPDDYENMLSRLFYYMKILYKPLNFKFEHETRIIVDANIINSGQVESFSGDGFHFTYNILEMIYGRHLIKEDNKYILLLDSFPDINLEEYI